MALDRATGGISHHRFADLPGLLNSGDMLVLNETRVIPARLAGKTQTGTEVEFLFVRFTSEGALGMVRGLKRLKSGMTVDFGHGLSARFVRRDGEMGILDFGMDYMGLKEWLAAHGEMPLPPYLSRSAEPLDRERYQTVFAARDGSCAAPTAGLHFSPELLARLGAAGVGVEKLCLHVGPGTFKPMTDEDISNHRLDPEFAEVPQALYDKLAGVKRAGGRVVAVGTTVTRALETAALKGGGFAGETALFIRPGFAFKSVDALITNFHLPKSSLLALVCAFAGREKVLAAYAEAVKGGYRFYSYGDAMLIR